MTKKEEQTEESMKKLQPIGERVLIEPRKDELKTKGGLYIPDTAKESKKEGKIIALGQFDSAKFPLKVGDVVIYGGYSHDEVEVDGQKLVVVEAKDIAAKFE